MKSQLDLTPFGVGFPSVLWPDFHCLKDFPQLLLVSIGEWFALSSRSEVRVLGECKCTYVNGSFTMRGRR